MIRKLKNAVIFVYGSVYASSIWYIVNIQPLDNVVTIEAIFFALAVIIVIFTSFISIFQIIYFLIELFCSGEK